MGGLLPLVGNDNSICDFETRKHIKGFTILGFGLILSLVTQTNIVNKNSFPHKRLVIAELQSEPNQNHLLTNLEGFLLAWLFVHLFGHHIGNSYDVTLAYEDDQVTQPFPREETDR